MNPAEQKVMEFLAEHAGHDECCWNFAGICEETGLERKVVRRACRSLARKGLAEFHKGLWNDDGKPAGAGYCASRSGCNAFSKNAQ